MKLVSEIKDGKIDAVNVLLVMTIKEYLGVAKDIIDKNEFQRKLVRSKVYEQLKKDLRNNCTMPPIVLATKQTNRLNLDNITKEQIEPFFGADQADQLIILDGLQRTCTIIELEKELEKDMNSEAISKFYNSSIRIEIYLGINKIGILYRMLTLNTGQTPMSLRHQIEIIYSGYNNGESIKDISFFTEKNSKQIKQIGEYQFRDVMEGFHSYLERNEQGIERTDILKNIDNLEKLASENSDSDLFENYITTYNNFVKRIDMLTDHWELATEQDEELKLNAVFGKDILQIFTKPQALSGFGAAIGILKDLKIIKDFESVKQEINNIGLTNKETETIDNVMQTLLLNLEKIKQNAKKIGVEQRVFFTYFFRELFNNKSDSYLNIDQAIANGFNIYISRY
ncbi:hypothetical protein EZS27_025648 [termite gut metagenome]|uniref:DUF262 domain-containing protein n=1 Tax=termite gut metagenome TaxID=433724 RepID=A0A5J4QWF5_9ZZZZ